VAEQLIETARVMVVSREPSLLTPLSSISDSNAWQLETAVSAWDAIERIESGDTPQLLLLDLPRGDRDSQGVLRSLRRIHPGLPIILLCSAEDADRNKAAGCIGSQEILLKPLDEAQLEAVLRRYLVCPSNGEVEIASGDIEQIGRDSFFVSASPVSQKLRTQVQLLAETDIPILILGETGSGKDTVARLIHKWSIRSGFEFLKVQCADMPAELLEAELFGNALSGIGRNGPSKFERVNNGTIFFDEITEMPLSLQSRLMQILQKTALRKPDAGNGKPVNFRVLAASSVDIERALEKGRLREDLYCRLSAFTIQIPPLRQRRSEIVILMQHIMHRLSKQYALPPRTFSATALNACKNYAWPGNLKELEGFVKRYLVVGDTDQMLNEVRPELTTNNQKLASSVPELARKGPGAPELDAEEDDYPSIPKSLKSLIHSVKSEAERKAIELALQKTGWNRKAAARLLQVSYRTMLYKIDQYHMSAPQPYVAGFAYGTNGGGKELKKN
jgi:two-component system response regulator AtoC